jgi:hypothetical protein
VSLAQMSVRKCARLPHCTTKYVSVDAALAPFEQRV